MEHIVVADITVPGGYDEAANDVKYIIHLASPFANPELFGGDLEALYVQPAVKGTVGMLESANKTKSVERVVITSSIYAIASPSILGTDTIVNGMCPAHPPYLFHLLTYCRLHLEEHRSATSEGPYSTWLLAYAASKVRAYDATKQWMVEHMPSFDLINILPTFVLGRGETATNLAELLRGPNGLLMGPILGHPAEMPNPGVSVHVNDVAAMHVRSLDHSIPGNEDYLASSHSFHGIQWADGFDIVKDRYPKECKEGIFQVDDAERPRTAKLMVDASKAERAFGFAFTPFKEQITSVGDQYLMLRA